MFKSKYIFLILISLTIFSACSTTETDLMESPDQTREFLMGTVVELHIFNEGKEDVLNRSIARIEELEQIMSSEIAESEVSLINHHSGKKPVEVSEELYELIERSIEFGRQSGGVFEVTVGSLTNLWRIGFDDASKPTQSEIDQVLPLINDEKIQLNADEKTVFLVEQDMKMDLGAIAKGYITDEVRDLFIAEGVTSAIIDLGGNVFVLGNRPTGDEWSVGVQNPFLARGEIVGSILTSDQSIVTSGIYERYLEIEGEHYHHLLDPKTGYPFENELAGVTIVSGESVVADALSTIVYGKGLDHGLEFIEMYPEAEAIFVTKNREIYLSSGLVDGFHLYDDDFIVIDE